MTEQEGRDMIKRHEGVRFLPYRDHLGILTIGIGHNLSEGLTPQMVKFIFDEDVKIAKTELCRVFPADILNCLPSAKYWVLVDMMFQLGASKFRSFRKMIRAINKLDYKTAAKEMLNSRWARQSPLRARELASIMEE